MFETPCEWANKGKDGYIRCGQINPKTKRVEGLGIQINPSSGDLIEGQHDNNGMLNGYAHYYAANGTYYLGQYKRGNRDG